MSIQVILDGTTYSIPTQGQNPAWGDDLSALLQGLVASANGVTGPSDILPTSFTVANNVASPTNITGLFFNPTIVRSAIISYSIYRSTNSAEASECGQMMITYSSMAGTFELARYNVGESGLTFSITTSGQIKYISSSLSGTGYSGKMKFSASAFLQA